MYLSSFDKNFDSLTVSVGFICFSNSSSSASPPTNINGVLGLLLNFYGMFTLAETNGVFTLSVTETNKNGLYRIVRCSSSTEKDPNIDSHWVLCLGLSVCFGVGQCEHSLMLCLHWARLAPRPIAVPSRLQYMSMERNRDRWLMGTDHIFHRNLFSCSCPTEPSPNTSLSWANLGKRNVLKTFAHTAACSDFFGRMLTPFFP